MGPEPPTGLAFSWAKAPRNSALRLRERRNFFMVGFEQVFGVIGQGPCRDQRCIR
jgi:hypothetical protein